jgi:hypothetical protein
LDRGVVNVDAQVSEFDANTRYPYNLDITYRDVRKNPLWYVAEYNVNYDGSSTYSWATTPDEGYYFSWSDAMKAFTTATNASAASPTSISNYYLGTGCKFAGWHLPTLYEYNSIVPGRNSAGGAVDLFSVATNSGATYSETTYLSFGYNQETMGASGTYMTENSYWYKKSTNVIYAIRYCGSADYCSAWKYELVTNSGNAANPGMLIISATLLGRSLSTSDAATQFGTDNDKWESIYWGNNDSYGAVQRTFSGRGNRSTGSGTAGNDRVGFTGFYWLTSLYSTNVPYHGAFNTSDKSTAAGGSSSNLGTPIRLFKNNQKRYFLEEATADDIGKIVCSKAHIHDNVSNVTCGGIASGMIAYISSKGHGLAMALTDYKDANGTPGTGDIWWSDANTGGSKYTTTRPTSYASVSAWRLPTKADYDNMMGANGCQSHINLREMKGRQGVSCGGTEMRNSRYWSSTVYSGSSYYNYYFPDGNWQPLNINSYTYPARACFTF